jgi:3-isopropylmalate/(R)-2-methylmalate dehydratase large subunit
MTMSQKILADHAGLSNVVPGELISAHVDMVLGNDITSPVAISEFHKAGFTQVFDPNRVTLILDHFTPNKDIKPAEQTRVSREFPAEQGLPLSFDVGKSGHRARAAAGAGLIASGELLVARTPHLHARALGAFSTGAGSTDMAAAMATGSLWFKVPSALKFILTGKPGKYGGGTDLILHIIGLSGVDGARYKSMEFTGEGLKHLSMDDRFTVANMAVEAGAKNGIFEVDDKTVAYMEGRVNRPYKVYAADPDAVYDAVYEIDLGKLQPTVSFPHLPENTKTPEAFGEITIDQVVIGSCTNGRLEDPDRSRRRS